MASRSELFQVYSLLYRVLLYMLPHCALQNYSEGAYCIISGNSNHPLTITSTVRGTSHPKERISYKFLHYFQLYTMIDDSKATWPVTTGQLNQFAHRARKSLPVSSHAQAYIYICSGCYACMHDNDDRWQRRMGRWCVNYLRARLWSSPCMYIYYCLSKNEWF